MKTSNVVWFILFVVGVIAILAVKAASVESEQRRSGSAPLAVQEPLREPTRRTYEGEGTDITPVFRLRPGAALVSVDYRWSLEIEHFSATLSPIDGGRILGGLLANETSVGSSHAPVSVRRLVTVPGGDYVVQVDAARGNAWHVEVTQ